MNHLRFFLLFFLLLVSATTIAQQVDSVKNKADSIKNKVDTVRKKPDTLVTKRKKPDTVKITERQIRKETKPSVIDSVSAPPLPISKLQPSPASDSTKFDSSVFSKAIQNIPAANSIDKVLSGNKFLNAKAEPQYFANEIKTWKNGKELFFYIMCGLLLILGMFKTFYRHYFSTIFTVYFNTSLRQTQLSEQLLQAKLPSFILNILFVLMSGIFVWLLFLNSYSVPPESPYVILQICTIAIAGIYFIKFCFLKFLGWISDIQDITNYYIFIIFLVNKLLAIILIPFVILLAFGKEEWMSIYITSGLLIIGVLIISRYIKSYGLLRQKFPVTPFHFMLFFVGAELLPLLIIYKVAVNYLLQ